MLYPKVIGEIGHPKAFGNIESFNARFAIP